MKPSQILHADPSSDGYLEWTSGLIVIQRTLEQWQEYVARHTGFDHDLIQLKRTLIHETFHFYQIVCTGWLYRFAVELASQFHATLGDGEHRLAVLEQLLAGQPIAATPGLVAASQALDSVDGNGLSVRSLIESAAYLYEFRAEYPEQGSSSFAQQRLIERLPEEYTATYDHLSNALSDEDAFELLLPVTLAALCFETPTAAFEAATSHLVAHDRDAWPDDPVELARWLGEMVMRDIEVLGSGVEVAERRDQLGLTQHAVYYKAIRILNDGAEQLPPLTVLTHPSTLATKPDQLLQPVALQNGVMWVPERLNKSGQDMRSLISNQRLLAALSVMLQDQLHLPRPRAYQLSSCTQEGLDHA